MAILARRVDLLADLPEGEYEVLDVPIEHVQDVVEGRLTWGRRVALATISKIRDEDPDADQTHDVAQRVVRPDRHVVLFHHRFTPDSQRAPGPGVS